MKTTPIYIKNLSLKNIRTFGEVELNFENEDGTLPQWTIILGDNGIGKSTLLQCVAWMKPFLPYMKKETPSDFKPAPIINDEQNETLLSLIRKNPISQKEGTYLKAIFQADKELNTKNKAVNGDICVTNMILKLKPNGELKDVEPSLITKGEKFYNNDAVIYAYSASRTLGKQNIDVLEIEDTIPGFIAENTILYDAHEILHTINYAALGSDSSEKSKYQGYFNKVKEMLISLLPDIQNLKDVEITSPKLVDNRLKQGEFLITTKHGEKIPFEDFSLGYKTVVSWSVDLSWRLFNKYPDSPNPLFEPAIVLIDELDLHLHPIWQTEIINNLSKHFPKVQFIATAHSPLMVQSDINANFAVLKFNADINSVEIINEPIGVDGWRIDQILTSEFFGLKSSRGPEYDKLLTRRRELIAKKTLTPQERKEVEVITEKLSQYPSGDSSEEIEDRKIVRQIIADFKKTGKVIKI